MKIGFLESLLVGAVGNRGFSRIFASEFLCRFETVADRIAVGTVPVEFFAAGTFVILVDLFPDQRWYPVAVLLFLYGNERRVAFDTPFERMGQQIEGEPASNRYKLFERVHCFNQENR